MNKEKRRLRHLRNKRKDEETKKQAWESGRIIYENHNNQFFSPEFSIKLVNRIVEKLNEGTDFIKLKKSAIDAVLMYSPEIEKVESWYYLKKRLEDYWDGRQ